MDVGTGENAGTKQCDANLMDLGGRVIRSIAGGSEVSVLMAEHRKREDYCIRGVSEIAKPRVRIFINCQPDPPPKPPIPPPKTWFCRALHSTMHSYTFPNKAGRVLKDLGGGGLGGGKGGGWRFMKTRGCRFPNPGFRKF